MKDINYKYINKIKNQVPNISEFLSYDKIRELRRLTNDPHVWSCIQSRKSGLLALDYYFINSESKHSNIFSNINYNDLINSALDSLFYGFQAFEIEWEWRKSYLIKNIIPLPQELFQIDFNNNLKININGSLEEIDNNKIIFCFNDKSLIAPLGSPLLEKVWWSAKFKAVALRYWVDYIERFGMPMILAKTNRNSSDEEMNELLSSLQSMAGNSILISPKDMELEYKESERHEAVETFTSLIELCNKEISKTILSQTLTTEIQSGSLAAAQAHLAIRQEIIESDARMIESFINSIFALIEKVNGFNFGTKFQFSLKEEDMKAKIERDSALAAIGVSFTKDYWKKSYKLTDEDIM